MFTVNGEEITEIFMVLDGAHPEPELCVRAVAVRSPEQVLCRKHMDEFIEENIVYLTQLCAEVHVQWAEMQMQPVAPATLQ